MTSFGDVNVGDKVRLTHKKFDYPQVTFIAGGYDADGMLKSQDAMVLVAPLNDVWSVEVLEPAPKPLPRTKGHYIDERGDLWDFDGDNFWSNLYSGQDYPIHGAGISPTLLERTFMPLVPYSAVEEARAEVVKEIVAWLGTGGYIASEIERKFLGGKA